MVASFHPARMTGPETFLRSEKMLNKTPVRSKPSMRNIIVRIVQVEASNQNISDTKSAILIILAS